MKAQTKKASLIEAIANIVAGIGVAFTGQIIVFHFMGIPIALWQNVEITFWFTLISLVRQFILRRVFNWFTEHSGPDYEREERLRKQLGRATKALEEKDGISSDVYLLTGERIPGRETEAINHLTRPRSRAYSDESWRQFCRRKK